MTFPLTRKNAAEIPAVRRMPVNAQALVAASEIVEAVRTRGADALREKAEQFGDIEPGAPLVIERDALQAAADRVDDETLAMLKRAAERITAFAEAQNESLHNVEVPVPGGVALHRVVPVERAGCYAPGGRYPLPSSVLMTACTARAAGVKDVTVASPKPNDVTLAAAFVAGADRVLAAGGAQAIAAMAYGAGEASSGGVPAADAVVGPGNKYVTAAKQLVSGVVTIDMLAGPSELLVLADHAANAAVIAADLLAQAEHDPDAIPMLVCTDEALIARVEDELERQLADLPTAEIARQSLTDNGFAVFEPDRAKAIALADQLAAEHLEILMEGAAEIEENLQHAGGVFVGQNAAEVLGDYGAGPNHTLPTGGTARSAAGLSVFTFLRTRTALKMNDDVLSTTEAAALLDDTVQLARLEGLEAHARAAEIRRG